MKYTAEEINRFRDYVAQASDYVQDLDDDELYENLDSVLDFLVWFLDTIEKEDANA